MIKLPTKPDIIIGLAFVAIGTLTLIFFPTFKTAGWNALIFGVTVFIFPGPQLRERYKQKRIGDKEPQLKVQKA